MDERMYSEADSCAGSTPSASRNTKNVSIDINLDREDDEYERNESALPNTSYT